MHTASRERTSNTDLRITVRRNNKISRWMRDFTHGSPDFAPDVWNRSTISKLCVFDHNKKLPNSQGREPDAPRSLTQRHNTAEASACGLVGAPDHTGV